MSLMAADSTPTMRSVVLARSKLGGVLMIVSQADDLRNEALRKMVVIS